MLHFWSFILVCYNLNQHYLLFCVLFRMGVGFQHAAVKQTLLPCLPLLSKQYCRELSNNTVLVSKVKRPSYLRTYPALMVQSDGSSFYVRYHEPRSIIQVLIYLKGWTIKSTKDIKLVYISIVPFSLFQLPLDVSTLTPEQLKIRLAKRNPKKKVTYVKEEQDTYQPSKYIKLVKKSKKAAAWNAQLVFFSSKISF